MSLERSLINLTKCILENFRDIVHSIIVYGSASRPNDFSPCVSDVDLLVIVSRKPSYGRVIKILDKIKDVKISPLFLTVDEVKKVVQSGHLLGYLLYYDSKVFYDDGTFKRIREEHTPVINEYTKQVLFKSAFVALALAVEDYFKGSFIEATSHLYHSLRHAIRLKTLEEFNYIPISDNDNLEAIRKLRLPLVVENCFKRLINIRKRGEASQWLMRTLINATLRSLSSIFNFNFSDWVAIELKITELVKDGILTQVKAFIEKGRLKWQVNYFKDNKILKEIIY